MKHLRILVMTLLVIMVTSFVFAQELPNTIDTESGYTFSYPDGFEVSIDGLNFILSAENGDQILMILGKVTDKIPADIDISTLDGLNDALNRLLGDSALSDDMSFEAVTLPNGLDAALVSTADDTQAYAMVIYPDGGILWLDATIVAGEASQWAYAIADSTTPTSGAEINENTVLMTVGSQFDKPEGFDFAEETENYDAALIFSEDFTSNILVTDVSTALSDLQMSIMLDTYAQLAGDTEFSIDDMVNVTGEDGREYRYYDSDERNLPDDAGAFHIIIFLVDLAPERLGFVVYSSLNDTLADAFDITAQIAESYVISDPAVVSDMADDTSSDDTASDNTSDENTADENTATEVIPGIFEADCVTHGNNIVSTGQRATVQCPAGCGIGSVWGTDVYTNDSSVCFAAIHAGVSTFEAGGVFTIIAVDGQERYEGTFRNGVNSMSYGQWGASFSFEEE